MADEGRNRARTVWTGGAGGLIVLAVGGAIVGSANPWNLVVVDRWLNHPWLAGLVVILATGLLCHLYARAPWVRVAYRLGMAGFLGVWLLACWASRVLNDWPEDTTGPVTNQHNDVEVSAVSDYNVWAIWLRADRGFWSRENEVVVIGYGDSGPPAVDLRFTGPDELTVTSDGEVVYRLRFDPHDLSSEESECRRVQSEFGGGVGCV